MASLYLGELAGARCQLELALSSYDAERDKERREKFGSDTSVAARALLAYASWQLGDLQRARRLIEEAIRLGRKLDHLPSTLSALHLKVVIESAREDPASVVADAENLLRISQQHGFDFYALLSRVYLSWARGRLGDARSGADELRNSLDAYASQGNRFGTPAYLGFLAELEAAAGDIERGLALIDEGLATAREGGQRVFDAFLHRLRGDILLERDPANPAPAEEAFQAAIAVAKEQGARSYELLASLSLANLYQSAGCVVEAHAVLAPALEGFSPTPEMPGIAEAEALLVTLSQTDEVKAQAAQRQRLTHLEVAYGNALIAARGYGAPETTEAFARARESASGDKDAPERLAADYGLWVGSLWRADLQSMRAHAAAFLSDVEARPDSPEAGVAHRAAGATRWFAGEYREARDHFERALALFQPGRDDDLAFRFGADAGVGAMGFLAIASWPLGEVDRAISFNDRMQTRMANLTHVGALAVGRMFAAMFELMRGDHARAAANAFELVRLARQYDMSLYLAYGVFLEGWATAASGATGDALERMRHGVELMRKQNVLLFDGLLKIALAEAEAREGDPARAIAILDEALATCDRAGYRAFEAELHRARGEILLKRDPADPAPAEEALLTAIAVARRQSTRSFQLRAALSLAKLYQSTDRSAKAHAVLAPALDGFSPTPEMPEIAEAEALLAALAETDEVKSAAAARQRRLQLQTRYGQAMMYSRGFASDKSKTAFARARTLAAGVDNASERFDAYYGLFIGSLARGELSLARETAESFLREAETEGRMTEASVARRCVGHARLYQGDLIGAEANLAEALGIYDPERDRDAKFRFGMDTAAGATSLLVLASWGYGRCRTGAVAERGGVGARGRGRSRADPCERLPPHLSLPDAPWRS